MKKIRLGRTRPRHFLSLLEYHWREQNELAKLLHCPPHAVHKRLCKLAGAEYTVVSAGGAFALLRRGWKKKDLLNLICAKVSL